MSKKEKTFLQQMVMPIAVLTAICLCCSAALAFTQNTTKPFIDAAATAEAELARTEVFPGATEFTKVEGELPEGAKEIYEVGSGEGYVITALTKGFGGPIEVMTGVNTAGEILGIKILAMTETSGLGTQIEEPWYIEKYVGLSNVDEVETIAGSTISSVALKKLEQTVLAMAKDLSGGAVK